MSTESREELISAYLDGELSDDERAQVEKWLTESAPLRQFHDELRALRLGMQSLKRHELDHDISGAVLRRAEQSVLRSADPKPVTGTIRPAQTTTSWWNRGAGWRRVAWPAIAVAAALVILVYDVNRRPAERELARAPEQEERASELQRDLDDQAPTDDFEAGAAGEARNRALKRESGQVEALQREHMPQLKSPASSPARASEPAAAPAGTRRLLDPVSKLQVAGGLLIECTPQYLRAGTFEKLLDEKKIKWRRVAQNESRDKKTEADSAEPAKGQDDLAYNFAKGQTLRATYVVDASEEQIDEILGELEKDARHIAGAQYEYLRAVELGLPARRQSLVAGKGGGVTITLVAPAPASPADEAP